jgi:hypothetical protein
MFSLRLEHVYTRLASLLIYSITYVFENNLLSTGFQQQKS